MKLPKKNDETKAQKYRTSMKMEKLSNLKKIASFIFTEVFPQTGATEKIKHQMLSLSWLEAQKKAKTANFYFN
ncbi:CLUMA_CG005812, isoform A [Clunio marinus]|uniref:CLUMA_CG005812, isoform A n=1 Tax=Clunio marinus TaxID=568069 RepID=A0A1J1I098_9DIPT|nr:CLUMA_CG005812, isoform A [Clunio marinus]